MLKSSAIALIVSLIGATAHAGWFSPNPPVVVSSRVMAVYSGAVIELPVDFTERSTYRLSLLVEPKVGFHSPEGREIDWGESLAFRISIASEGKTYFTYSATETLDHSLGWVYAMQRVPSDIPYGTHVLRVEFTRVGPEFGSIYHGARTRVAKLPYILLVD